MPNPKTSAKAGILAGGALLILCSNASHAETQNTSDAQSTSNTQAAQSRPSRMQDIQNGTGPVSDYLGSAPDPYAESAPRPGIRAISSNLKRDIPQDTGTGSKRI